MSIEIKNLSYVYNEGTAFARKALDDVSVSIPSGEFVGLIGHTGSGKSTLIQHLNGLLKPASGQIWIGGKNICENKGALKTLRQQVGLVFQYPEHQLFEMTVYQDVAFGPKNMGLSEQEVDRRVRDALESTGLPESTYEKSPFDLSGGQKRRAAIAGVLAMQPEVLVLDEPTAGLDPGGREDILQLIQKMHQRKKMTVILVSHSMEDISRLVQRVLVMHQAKLVMDGSPTEIFSQVEKIESLGLAAPVISDLCKELRKNGFQIPEDIYKVEDAVECLYRMLNSSGQKSQGQVEDQ